MTVQEPKVQRTAEPLYDKDLPKTPCISLDEVICLIARHGVEIPEREAKQIEDFIEQRISSAPIAQFQRGLPLTPVMEFLYRRWFAASRLHWELMEHAERSPKWRNWGVTGQPVRLDAEDRKRAMTMLERMIAYNQDRFNDFLFGRESPTQRASIDDSSVFDAVDRKWLSCLGFETEEILEFFRADEPSTDPAEWLSEPRPTSVVQPISDNEASIRPGSATDIETSIDEASASPDSSQAHRLSQAAHKELPPSLTTSELAAALADTDDCNHKTGRDYEAWLQYLQKSPPVWAKMPEIRVLPGRAGRNGSARWEPLKFTKAYVTKQGCRKILAAVGERFRKVDALAPWKEKWTIWAEDYRESLKRH
ncbi:hypothetical protein WT98_17195 [Burkholderia territorii]|nr:hypothetical protein WT98_17195 [Burkholderia territorii]